MALKWLILVVSYTLPVPLRYYDWTIACPWALVGMVPLVGPWLACSPQASYCGTEYSLAAHYQIPTLFTGGEVSNSENGPILLISQDIQEKSNICVILKGIFKFWSRKKIMVFFKFKIIKIYYIFIKTGILKIPSTITQILLLFNTLPDSVENSYRPVPRGYLF